MSPQNYPLSRAKAGGGNYPPASPRQARARYRLTLALSAFALLAFASVAAAQSPIGNRIDGAAAGDRAGRAVAVSGDGLRVAIGASLNDVGGEDAGHVRVYGRAPGGATWTPLGAPVVGAGVGDNLGRAVALSRDGRHVAVGAPRHDGGGGDAGLVRVFRYDDAGAWRQVGQDLLGEAPGDLSGTAVALSSDGTRLAVGAPGAKLEPADAGRVRVYDYDAGAGAWVRLGGDLDGEAAFGQLGWSVSLSGDGDRLAVGAPFSSAAATSAGRAVVYEYDGATGEWGRLGGAIEGAAAGDLAGWAIALSRDGRHLAVGSPYSDLGGADAGAVRIYGLAAGAWQPRGGSLLGRSGGDLVGSSVALAEDGARVIFGSAGRDAAGADAGQACLYDWDASAAAWAQTGLDVDGAAPGDQFGTAVALSDDGECAVVGAPAHDGGGVDAGQVTAYEIEPIGAAVSVSEAPAAGLRFGPNPARDFVEVAGEPRGGTLELRLLDAVGREVARGLPGERRLSVPVASAGVHTLLIRHGGRLERRRLIVLAR